LILRASSCEDVDAAQGRGCDFECLAARDEEIAGETGFDFHDVGFDAEIVDLFGKDYFGSRHNWKFGKMIRTKKGAMDTGGAQLCQKPFPVFFEKA
jgi:hypothetical protein